jgi:hypothetical protein
MHTSALDGAVSTQARVVLVPGGLLDPATDAGGIDEPINLAADLDELVYRIHSGPGDLINDHTLLPGQLVEQA